ncbi:MAG: hypothetical protein JWL71_4130 [Acidobacteria bacterium]|nr:hypothetical protein [Acidobacteriota bacterium]
MSIVDDRGRVGGRINAVDAGIALLLVVLIPLAYGSFLLFRTPQPRLTGVNPAKMYQGKNLRVEIQGENLRPFMRVTFNTVQGRTFMLGNTNWAMVDLPDLEAGTYDVELFDYRQSLAKLPQALTILPLAPVPTVQMEVSGAFTGMAIEAARRLSVGQTFPPSGAPLAEVLSLGAPTQGRLRLHAGDAMLELPLIDQRELPATLRVRCYVASDLDGTLRCMVPGPAQAVPVAPDSMLTLAAPQGWVNFQIATVRAPSQIVKP